jgi:carboxynorspermidine decarboxylase
MNKRPALSVDCSQITDAAFVIDEAVLRHNLSILKHIREQTGCKMYQALKTWSTYPLFSVVREYLDGTEVSSLNEARLGHEYFNEDVHMFASAYSESEFGEVLKYASTIIFNSFNQWKKFKTRVVEFNATHTKQIHCGLRINPEYTGADEHGDLWSPCAPGSRLGIRRSEFEKELAENPSALEGISGFHFHIFYDKTFDELDAGLAVVEQKFGTYFGGLSWINCGGGQKMTEDNYDVTALIARIIAFQTQHSLTMHFEPGACICREAGALVANVLDVVERDDVPFKIAILDISFNAHTPDFLLSTDLDMPVLGATIVRGESADLARVAQNSAQHLYLLAGGTCVTGDKLGHYHAFTLPLSVGDKVVLLDGIQYNMVQCTMFNGVQHPSIVVWKNGVAETLRTFTYEDFKARMG